MSARVAVLARLTRRSRANVASQTRTRYRGRGSNNKSYQNTSETQAAPAEREFRSYQKDNRPRARRPSETFRIGVFLSPSANFISDLPRDILSRPPPRKSIVHITKLTADVNGSLVPEAAREWVAAGEDIGDPLKERERERQI